MVSKTGVVVMMVPGDTDKTEFQAMLLASGKSAMSKYTDVVVGRPGLLPLLKFELLTFLFGSMPGALGYWLRKKAYPGLFGSLGKGVVFGRDVCIRHPHRIFLGDNVVIDDNCVLDAKGEHYYGITVGSGVLIGRNTILSCKGGSIEIGDNSNISANCMLLSESRLSIGKNVLIAGMTYIVAGGNHGISRIDIPIISQPCVSKGGIRIEDNCWLGANVTVLDGVTIGRDSVIGAGAVVTKSIPEFAIAVGVPAKVIKFRNGGTENAQD
jgi:acetyltransferase-like isoleucine patch superfamily enzyme